MNDLMPPPRRQMPEPVRERLLGGLRRQSRQPTHAWATPWVAAAAVAAIAVGGFAVATQLGGNHRAGGLAPADTRTAPSDPETTTPTPPATPSPTDGPAPSTSMSADKGYENCADQIRKYAARHGETVSDIQGRVFASTPEVTTVVVTDGQQTYYCIVQPHEALSPAAADSAQTEVIPDIFRFILQSPQLDGSQLAYAGGELPRGVTELTYVFPDGHEEPAVTMDGYWLMQYSADQPWFEFGDPSPVVEVRLSGPAGNQTVIVDG